MRTKIVKWGNSLGLRIPKSFAEEVQVADGSTVDLTMEDGHLAASLQWACWSGGFLPLDDADQGLSV